MDKTKIAIIAGGTGSVGEGIVKTFLENDWMVVVPGRSKKGLDNLADYCNHHRNLKLHEANISKPASAALFFEFCKAEYPSFDIFVATLGGWRQGSSILELSWEEWQATLEDNLSSHFLCMKLGYPLLNEIGSFVHINGMGAEAVIPTAGPTVAAAAAQMRLALTLAAEQKGDGKKVYELVLGLVNTRSRNIAGEEGSQLITPSLTAAYILMLQEKKNKLSNLDLHKLPDANSVLDHTLK